MPPRIQHCLSDFNHDVAEALALADSADDLRILKQNGSYHRIGISRRELLAALALLKIHVAWEEYLEGVFLRYMCGAQALTPTTTPTLTITRQANLTIAKATLLGGNQFLKWAPRDTIRNARSVFNLGEPFATQIGASSNTLIEIASVRNRFAHRSDFCITNFNNVLLAQFGYKPIGINVGRFLRTKIPARLRHQAHTKHFTFLEYYSFYLEGLATALIT